MRQRKLALSMRGGAYKAISYLGLLKALEEEDIKVSMMIGSSAGALVAVAYSMGYKSEEILEISKEFNPIKLLGLESLKERSLVSHEKIAEFIERFLKVKNLEETPIPVFIQATDLISGKSITFEKGEIMPPLIGSIAIPGLIRPVDYNSKLLVDGDLTSVYKTKFLKEKGSEVVFGLRTTETSGIDIEDMNGPINSLMSSVGISMSTIQDLDAIIDPPDMLIDGLAGGIKSFLKNDKVDELFEYGYKLSKTKIDEIRKILFPNEISWILQKLMHRS